MLCSRLSCLLSSDSSDTDLLGVFSQFQSGREVVVSYASTQNDVESGSEFDGTARC